MYALVIHGGISSRGARRTVVVEGKWIVGGFLGKRERWAKSISFPYAKVLKTWHNAPSWAERQLALPANYWTVNEPMLNHPERYQRA